MRSFIFDFAYLRMKNWIFSGTYPLIYYYPRSFFNSNSLYASLFLESLSLAYNEVHLYVSTAPAASKNDAQFKSGQN